jgi:Putative peptidoglycan binding domain
MTEDRTARGCWELGNRRLRSYALAVLAVMVAGASVAGACAPLASGSSGGAGTAPPPRSSSKHKSAKKAPGNPFSGRGMWIWELPSSNGGNLSSIVARARRNGVSTLMIKSGDGSGTWSQFNPQLVSSLHADGLRVCAWQYVYGTNPVAEAQVGAAAVSDRADCLLIDAESEYEGRYVSAQTYVKTLRQLIGANFPVALAGFPYVDYHPAFPYSVFLGPGGAQYNTPQMYWFDIGTTVSSVYAHTYSFNRLYQRPISPLGQISGSPPTGDIRHFRQVARSYRAPGVSWWDWQEGTGGAWLAISQPLGSLSDFTPDTSLASLSSGAQGDIVVWAQEHLISSGQKVAIDGAFGPKTEAAVMRFQTAHGLSPTGTIDAVTWRALLRHAPVSVHWTNRGARTASAASATGTTPVPKSASLPAKRNEIAAARGAGRPKR